MARTISCLTALMLAGCSTLMSERMDTIKQRAPHDLVCDDIKVFALNDYVIGAKGCGRYEHYSVIIPPR
jgi:hypothetical protein